MVNPKLTVVNAPENGLEIVSKAARTCYRSQDKDIPERRAHFISNILTKGHESVVEHVSVNFYLENVSRACATQILRHRVASYSQESQRYVKQFDKQVILPEAFDTLPEDLSSKVDYYLKYSADLYEKLVNFGMKPEDARYLLPEGTETSVFFTYNLRQIRHFIDLRMSRFAQKEIRMVALQMFDKVYAIYPWLLEDKQEAYRELINGAN